MFSKFQLFAALLAATVVNAVPTVKHTLTPANVPFNRNALKLTNVGISPDRTLTDPTIILCDAANCTGNCFQFGLVNAAQGVCQIPNQPNPFLSVAINNPDQTTINFAVSVGFTGTTCPSGLVQIPKSNTCFNTNPGGNSFIRLAGSTPAA